MDVCVRAAYHDEEYHHRKRTWRHDTERYGHKSGPFVIVVTVVIIIIIIIIMQSSHLPTYLPARGVAAAFALRWIYTDIAANKMTQTVVPMMPPIRAALATMLL